MVAEPVDVVIIGAGAAGLMCGIEAGKRGRRVVVLDHAKRIGQKIIMSGGGRCNFTNLHIEPEKFLSSNPHFVKSALKRYTQWDFIAMVERHQIAYHQRQQGQLFCDDSAKLIVQMLLDECQAAGVQLVTRQQILTVAAVAEGYQIETAQRTYCCRSLVIATGGLSMPKIGATPLGYQIAEQFGISVLKTTAGLVPFTLHVEDKDRLSPLSGISVECQTACHNQQFHSQQFSGAMLFTHRGLSGPAILQISNYWQAGQAIEINLLPEVNLIQELSTANPNQTLKTYLASWLPKRFIQQAIATQYRVDKPLKQYTTDEFQQISQFLQHWMIKPNGTEGYRTAEVTLGGVNTDELSSKTMEATKARGLYFIGEVVDVTGWLGGFNFQWAWSSGWCAGQFV